MCVCTRKFGPRTYFNNSLWLFYKKINIECSWVLTLSSLRPKLIKPAILFVLMMFSMPSLDLSLKKSYGLDRVLPMS